MSWILILVIAGGYNVRSVTTIPGFKTQEECVAALNGLKQMDSFKEAACVGQKK